MIIIHKHVLKGYTIAIVQQENWQKLYTPCNMQVYALMHNIHTMHMQTHTQFLLLRALFVKLIYSHHDIFRMARHPLILLS